MASSRLLVAALLVVVGLVGGALILSQAWRGSSAEPERATVLPVAQPLPDFTLTDDRGEPLTRDSLRGNWHAVFFGFTHCPDICPATLSQLAAARRRLAAAGQTPLPEILLVSVDPQRDSPDQLADYVARFGKHVRGATGSVDELRVLAGTLGIYFERGEADTHGAYGVDHSAAVLVIDESASLKALFSAPHQVDAFVNDLPLILSSP